MTSSYWTGKHVAITGAAGFIGRHLVRSLSDQGALVRAIVTKDRQTDWKTYGKNVEGIVADCTELREAVHALNGQEAVFHLAGLDGGYIFKRDHEIEIFQTNTRLALNVLEASRINSVSRLLLMSSIEVYPPPTKTTINESYGTANWFYEPVSGYAWAKRIAELAAKYYHNESLQIAIVRAGNVYGPGDNPDKGRVIPTFFQKARQNEPIHISVSKKRKFSFLYVEDLAMMLAAILERYAVCDPINVVGTQPISLQELAAAIIGLTRSKSSIQYEPVKRSTRNFSYDRSKLDVLGVQESFTLAEGLEAMNRALNL